MRSSPRRTVARPSVDRAFDGFLQASIDEDRKERLLSVMSALARLDLDPWKEAAELAALPTHAAIERLAGLIASLPDVSAVPRDSAGIAARLVAKLPSSQSAPDESVERPERGDPVDSDEQPAYADPESARGNSRWYSGPLLSVGLVFVVILLAFSIFSGRAPYDLFTPPGEDGAGASSLNVTPRAEPSATPSRPSRNE